MYEESSLELIRAAFGGGVFVDVGANIGNHSLFALHVLKAQRVIAFEPVPFTADLLQTNVALNGFQDRFSLYRFGLCDREAEAKVRFVERNLGATRLTISEDGGSLPLVRGDKVIEGHVNFIKIDVEGMEMEVLVGLDATITRCRPHPFRRGG